MENFYIDESGTMTKVDLHIGINKFFVICLIRVKDKDKLKRDFRRFISTNYSILEEIQDNKMFENGHFKELKGSSLTPDLKIKFVDHFIKHPYFELFFIKVDNKSVRTNFYENSARAFNYLIKRTFEILVEKNFLNYSDNTLHIDERNIKTKSKATLEEYLNIELATGKQIQKSFTVQYYQSENHQIIQIADVFANLYFSELITGNYKEQFEKLSNSGHLKLVLKFPF